jgi:GntR family transcriptional regulator, N-acetylglucosamine utilization regulator
MPLIDRRSIIPLYYQLATLLKDQVTTGLHSGELITGDKISSERDLMQQYGLSRNTVRKAIDELVKDGVIYKGQGQGNYIVTANFAVQSRIDTFAEHNLLIQRAGYTPSYKLIKTDERIPGSVVQSKLVLQPDEKVKRIKKVFYADGRPAILSTDYLPLKDNESDLEDIEHHGHEFFDFLEEKRRQHIDFILADIFPVNATHEISELLDCAEGTPLLLLHELMLDPSQEKPILFAENYYLTEFIHFSILRRRQD